MDDDTNANGALVSPYGGAQLVFMPNKRQDRVEQASQRLDDMSIAEMREDNEAISQILRCDSKNFDWTLFNLVKESLLLSDNVASSTTLSSRITNGRWVLSPQFLAD